MYYRAVQIKFSSISREKRFLKIIAKMREEILLWHFLAGRGQFFESLI